MERLRCNTDAGNKANAWSLSWWAMTLYIIIHNQTLQNHVYYLENYYALWKNVNKAGRYGM